VGTSLKQPRVRSWNSTGLPYVPPLEEGRTPPRLAAARSPLRLSNIKSKDHKLLPTQEPPAHSAKMVKSIANHDLPKPPTGKYPAKAHCRRVAAWIAENGGPSSGVIYLQGQTLKEHEVEVPMRVTKMCAAVLTVVAGRRYGDAFQVSRSFDQTRANSSLSRCKRYINVNSGRPGNAVTSTTLLDARSRIAALRTTLPLTSLRYGFPQSNRM
jgi:hypothetical protein